LASAGRAADVSLAKLVRFQFMKSGNLHKSVAPQIHRLKPIGSRSALNGGAAAAAVASGNGASFERTAHSFRTNLATVRS
jgi:hypothetical protein